MKGCKIMDNRTLVINLSYLPQFYMAEKRTELSPTLNEDAIHRSIEETAKMHGYSQVEYVMLPFTPPTYYTIDDLMTLIHNVVTKIIRLERFNSKLCVVTNVLTLFTDVIGSKTQTISDIQMSSVLYKTSVTLARFDVGVQMEVLNANCQAVAPIVHKLFEHYGNFFCKHRDMVSIMVGPDMLPGLKALNDDYYARIWSNNFCGTDTLYRYFAGALILSKCGSILAHIVGQWMNPIFENRNGRLNAHFIAMTMLQNHIMLPTHYMNHGGSTVTFEPCDMVPEDIDEFIGVAFRSADNQRCYVEGGLRL